MNVRSVASATIVRAQSEPVEHEKQSAPSTLDVSDFAEAPQPDLATSIPS